MSGSVLLYIFIMLITVLLAWIADRSCKIVVVKEPAYCDRFEKKRKTNTTAKLALLFMLLIPWFFMAFKGNSMDLGNYEEMFYSATSWKYVFSFGFDWGYFLLNFVVRIFTDNYLVFSGIVSFFILFLPLYTFWKMRGKISFTVLVAFYMGMCYLQAFNLIRIYLALSVIIFSSRWLFKKKILGYLIGVAIACMFHNSAIFCVLFILPFLPKNLSFITMFVVGILMVLFWIVPEAFIKLIPFERYQHYFEKILPLVVGVVHPVQCLAFILPLFLFNYEKKPSVSMRYLGFATFLFFIVVVTGYRIDVFGRLSIYCYPAIGFGFAQWVSNLRYGKDVKVIVSLYVLGYLVIITYLYFYSYLNIDGLAQYYFFWERTLI